MDFLSNLVRELRLMKDQPADRFYTACFVAVTAMLTIAYVLK